MIIRTRIPTDKYSFIEIEEEIDSTCAEKSIDYFKNLIEKNIVKKELGNIEVILDGKYCEKCNSQVIESIGISQKNNKPYHYIKCINNKGNDPKCNYIKWIDVSKIPENINIDEN